MTQLSGTVINIVYRSDDGYTVMELDVGGDMATAVGILPQIMPGESVTLYGAWMEHSTFGRQFKAVRAESQLPSGADGMKLYLASGLIRGIGEVLSERIVDTFGEDTFDVITYSPERLAEVRGISMGTAKLIAESFKGQSIARTVVMELQALGLTVGQAVAAYETYGAGAGELIAANPYRLIDDVHGIGFERADRIAQYIGIEPHSGFRLDNGIKHILKLAFNEGHTCLPETMLMRRAAELLQAESAEVADRLRLLAVGGGVVRRDYGGRVAVFLPGAYIVETDTALRVFDLSRTQPRVSVKSPDELFGAADVELSEEQERAVIDALTHTLHVITGGPGTGKTTIIKALLSKLTQSGANVALCAPTGRAAKRMSAATGQEAKTIHRLLEYGALPDEDEFASSEPNFTRNAENPLEADAVIVDEASMIDIFLFCSLLKALTPGTRLIIVGDADQLPSVGPGNVLRDLIDSGVCGVSRLSWFYRQQAGSGIIAAAHAVNCGKVPELSDTGDLTFLPANSPKEVVSAVLGIYRQGDADGLLWSTQVLCPIKKGLIGINNFNLELRELINPQQPGAGEFNSCGRAFHTGDKVMQLKNNYSKEWQADYSERGSGVFNGDMGVITEIDADEQEFTIEFDGERQAVYSYREAEQIEHAYAVTVHKAQGSEWDTVILPLYYGMSPFLTRNLLYTALTRARERVYVIGLKKTVGHMVANNRIERRYTVLRREIIQLIELFAK